MHNFTLVSCGTAQIFEVKVTELEYGQQISALFLIMLNALSGLVASAGNGLVIWTLMKSRVLRGPIYVILGTLSVLDFLVGIFLQPIWIATIGIPVLKSKTVCGFFYWGFALWVPVLSSIGALTILTLIALERFIAVVFYLAYNTLVTRSHAAIAVAAVLIFNLCVSVITYLDSKGTLYFTVISSITGICYTVIISCYFSIYIALKARKSLLVNRTSVEITKTIALASLVCGFCWLPFNIAMPLVTRTTDVTDPNSVLKTTFIYEWLGSILLGNSALNFGVYYWRNTTMRREIQFHAKRIFACCLCLRNPSVAPSLQKEDSNNWKRKTREELPRSAHRVNGQGAITDLPLWSIP